jgi:phosphotriesterase-related protein
MRADLKSKCHGGLLVLLGWLCSLAAPRQAPATPPHLEAAVRSNRVELSWSTRPGDFVLETTDRLEPGAAWWPARVALSSEGRLSTTKLAPAAHTRFYRLAPNRYSNWVQTVQGPIPADASRVMLPHEHLFTDLRGPTAPGYGQANVKDVVRVMNPLLVQAVHQGVGVLVECTGIGVGRNIPIIARLARESGLHVVVPTGVYGRDNFAPAAHRGMTEEDLARLFVQEIRQGIEATGIKAGFIKIATSDTGMTANEQKFTRAAGFAARDTGAAVASHTTTGRTARKQLDLLDAISPAIRFIWVHAQNEKSRKYHLELAARGAFIELDALGWAPAEDNTYLAVIRELHAAGFGDRILLSHDAGWYQPGQRNGGSQKPYTYLLRTFVPKLRAAGFDEGAIRMFLQDNPNRAFAFMRPPES